MKIIDLLNKIVNGEEVPKRINFCRRNFEYKKDICDYLCIDENFDKTEDYCLGVSICKWIFPSILNYEVEIIEEEKKIPEKLYGIINPKEGTEKVPNNEQLMFKINEIIDYLDYLKSKGD